MQKIITRAGYRIDTEITEWVSDDDGEIKIFHQVDGLKYHEAKFIGKLGAMLMFVFPKTGLQNFDERQLYMPGVTLSEWMLSSYTWVTEGFYELFWEYEVEVFSLLREVVPERPVSINEHAYFSGMVYNILEKYIIGESPNRHYLRKMAVTYYPNDVIEEDVTTDFVKI